MFLISQLRGQMRIIKITDEHQLVREVDQLPAELAIDTETTGLDPHTDSLVSIQISDGERVLHIDPILAPFLRLYDKVLVFHNFTFDMLFLHHYPNMFNGVFVVDTTILAHLIDENQEKSLDSLIQSNYNDNYKEIFWSKYKTYEEAPEQEKLEYSCKDAYYTYHLYKRFWNNLLSRIKLVEHVHRTAWALYETTRDGLLIDLDYITKLGGDLKDKIETLKRDIRSTVIDEVRVWEIKEWGIQITKRKSHKGKLNTPKPTFNISSNKQVGELLYDILELPEQLNKAKKRTVDDAALEAIQDSHPIIPLIRTLRESEKIYGTYVEGILDRAKGNKITPSFNVNGTVTGRISHSNPNMGNMPKEGGIREMFISSPNHKLISADYSQLEIVLAAHFSEDPIMIDTIKEGRSLHDLTASALGCERHLAKILNFAVMYGASEYKIRDIFKCSSQDAKDIITKFFETYKGLKRVIDMCHKCVEDGEPIQTPFGRLRHFPKEFENFWDKERAKRQSFNFLIQSTGGDITNRAFYLMSDSMKQKNTGRALFTVHDEIIVECKDGVLQEVSVELKETMQGVGKDIELRLDLSAEVSEPMNRWHK